MTTPFRTPDEETQYRAYLEHYDRTAHVVALGTTYAWTEEDLRELAMAARLYPFVPTAFNSSVVAGIVSLARQRFRPQLTRAQIIGLCAATLRTTVESVEQSLQWTANYMAFHDGGDPADEHPYPPTEP
jgi:hypothetical protein